VSITEGYSLAKSSKLGTVGFKTSISHVMTLTNFSEHLTWSSYLAYGPSKSSPPILEPGLTTGRLCLEEESGKASGPIRTFLGSFLLSKVSSPVHK
jgi:hypothetical protein